MNEVKKAMVMSAGIGSRLEPLTNTVPKPLVSVANRPVMDILFENLVNIGIKDVICNTYCHAQKIIQRYKTNNIGVNFNYIIEENLSGTAGGLKKCQHFFDKNEFFLVLSADGLSNADLKKGIKIHKNSNAIATIGIKKIPHEEISHFGVVVTDENGFITEFQEKPALNEAKSDFINTGIYIFDYKIFDYIPENTFYDFAKNVFPKLLAEHTINTFTIDEYWTDIGTIGQYKQSVNDLFDGKCEFKHSPIINTPKGAYIVGNSIIPSSAVFIGNSTVGSNCVIGENCTIENSIIWDNVEISDNEHIKDSIISSGCTIKSDITDKITETGEIIEKDILKI